MFLSWKRNFGSPPGVLGSQASQKGRRVPAKRVLTTYIEISTTHFSVMLWIKNLSFNKCRVYLIPVSFVVGGNSENFLMLCLELIWYSMIGLLIPSLLLGSRNYFVVVAFGPFLNFTLLIALKPWSERLQTNFSLVLIHSWNQMNANG